MKRLMRSLAFVLLGSMLAAGLTVARDEEEEARPKGPVKKIPPPGEAPGKPTPPGQPIPGTPKSDSPPPGFDPRDSGTKPAPGGPPGFDPGEGSTKPPTAPGMPATPGTPGSPSAPAEEGTNAYIAKLPDVAREAAIAKHPSIKDFLEPFTLAHDRMTVGSNKPARIAPVPLLWGKDKFPAEFGVVPFDDQNAAMELRTMKVGQVRSLIAFENYALDETERFLAPASNPAAAAAQAATADRYAAAEKLLTAVYFFHDAAREQNRRRGKSWDGPKAAIYDKLANVRIERLRLAGAARDWPRLKDMSGRYAELYRNNPKLLERVLLARLQEAEVLVQSETPTDLFRARELLGEYEARFADSKAESAGRIRAALKAKSAKMLREAEARFAVNKGEARNLLQNVEKIDPDNSNLRSMQQEMKLGYPVLIVGARRMPEFCSPALARFDSEHQVAELVFEGLNEAVPDETVGVRYLPAMTLDRGVLGSGYREFRLQGQVVWNGPDRRPFTAADVAGTLRLMRQKPALQRSEAAVWYDDPGFDPADPGRVRIRFKLGHPDPRSLLTMKILPAGLLLESNRTLDDPGFAKAPVGTGPFRYEAKPRGPNEIVKEITLLADPSYARRNGRIAQPFLREVRFVNTTISPDLVADFRSERLHLLTDVPTQDLPKFQVENNLGGKVRVVTATNPRRMQILAINHRRPGLQGPDVRRGLLHAVDRERILNDIFRRANQPEFHKALTGPFPPDSWAVPKPLGGTPPALFNRDLAAAKFRAYLAAPGAAPSFNLLYPDDEPLAKAACERLKLMLESPTSGDDRRIAIQLEALPPRELLRRVEDEGRYDLAYMNHDYRDDWYPQALSAALDPTAAVRQGRNIFGWNAPGSLPTAEDLALAQSLGDVRLYRDIEARLLPLSHRIHTQFNEAVPFIPLWQLDRHMVVSTSLKLPLDGGTEELPAKLLDPTTLFTNIGKWRVE